MTKHTDSSRSTDSGVSGNAQTGATEIRNEAYRQCADLVDLGCKCKKWLIPPEIRQHSPGCVGILAQVIRGFIGAVPDSSGKSDSENTSEVLL